jgi:hypothetical protein
MNSPIRFAPEWGARRSNEMAAIAGRRFNVRFGSEF